MQIVYEYLKNRKSTWQQYLNTSDFNKAFLFIGSNSIIIAFLQKEVCLIQTQAFSFFDEKWKDDLFQTKKKAGWGGGEAKSVA